jgi:hypothetical protein
LKYFIFTWKFIIFYNVRRNVNNDWWNVQPYIYNCIQWSNNLFKSIALPYSILARLCLVVPDSRSHWKIAILWWNFKGKGTTLDPTTKPCILCPFIHVTTCFLITVYSKPTRISNIFNYSMALYNCCFHLTNLNSSIIRTETKQNNNYFFFYILYIIQIDCCKINLNM